VDAPNPGQRQTASAFARGVFRGWGKIESVQFTPIVISGRGGRYNVDVGRGRIMHLATQPILGGDKKTAITHGNTQNLLNHTFYQAKTIKGSFKGGSHSFNLSDSNSYFNERMNAKGRLQSVR
jgi:hypothetical protein